ncbi:restriction endonuclease subunit S [Salinisphaera japonica]|uniref:Restriction endonuclease S n=1 Tax=Salinisphaera japonica YTM-1 TaxID=1209778 RepID=A0A423PPQ6_9GAMM|nr:restriction endonuclease subunit S [Salinisphaera japonica]ROO27573.1 restriction endonuclease S [Salinisphaera japonica YTM-1]
MSSQADLLYGSRAKWPKVQLADVAQVVNGGTPKSKVQDYWGGDVQWLTPKEMGGMAGRHIAATERTITETGLAKSSARLVPANSLILSTRAPIGHLAVNDVEMAFNQGCRGIVPSADLDIGFLYYFLFANRQQLNDLGTGTTFKELSATNLKTFQLPLPRLDEQKRIVAVLDQAFAALDRARAHELENLGNSAALLESFVESQLDQSEGRIATLQQLLDDGSIKSHLDGNHGSDYPRKDEFVSSGVPYISANCIIDGQIDFNRAKYLSEKRAAKLRKGVAHDEDVIFAHNASVGPVAILRTCETKVILGTSVTYYRCDPNQIDPEFLAHEMRGTQFRRQYEAVMKQATRNQVPITAQRKLSHTIPNIERQKFIAAACSKVADRTRQLSKQYDQNLRGIDQLRQTLLEKTFAGEL